MPSIADAMAAAVAHHGADRLAEAEALYHAVLREHPDQPDALHLLGVLTHQRGDAARAEALIRRAIALNPNAPMFYNNLGKVLGERGDQAAALESYRHAIELAPDYAEAHYNFGVALQGEGDHVAAATAFRRVRELAPNHFKAAVNLGAALLAVGQAHQAVEVLRDAFALSQHDPKACRALITATLYDPEADEAARSAEHQRFEALFARPLYAEWRPHTNSRDPDRRLRIGWLSSDFHDHPVARNLEPIFAHRDRDAFEAVCYADVAKPDGATALFQSVADVWRPICGRTDREVAQIVRDDQIDILVVLAGRFDQNRPLVAAFKPAPIQVSFHDPASSGMAAIDYLIADPVLVPRHTTERFAERVLHLPSFYIHRPLDGAPPVAPPPLAGSGAATFGSFNNPIKVNDAVVGLWAAVLQQVRGSRLMLGYRGRFAPLRDRIERIVAVNGVEHDRIDFGGGLLSHADHLALYNRIDIALDPFPFTGSTTTFEALWMGVPVITLAGENMAARWGASILHALKLDELVATSPGDYVAKAAVLTGDPSRLADLRATLRERLARSPLCDGPRRARQVERLFRAIWRRWCRQS